MTGPNQTLQLTAAAVAVLRGSRSLWWRPQLSCVVRPSAADRTRCPRGEAEVTLYIRLVFRILYDEMPASCPPPEFRRSSGDTIPNCLGELGEIRERTGIASDGHPAGTSGPLGVERLRPHANGQRLGGGERGETDGFVRRNCLVR